MDYPRPSKAPPYSIYGSYWRKPAPEPYPYKKRSFATWKIITIICLIISIITVMLLVCIMIPQCPLKYPCRTITTTTAAAAATTATTTTTTTATTTQSELTTIPSTEAEATTSNPASAFKPFMPYGKTDSLLHDQSVRVNFTADVDVAVNTHQLKRPVSITVGVTDGTVTLNENVVIGLYTLPYVFPKPEDGHYFYYREVNSAAELAGLSCLLNNAKVVEAYVFTWVNVVNIDTPNPTTTMQCTIVFDDTSVYVIRVYKEDILLKDEDGSTGLYAYNNMYNYEENMTKVAGQRLINYLKEVQNGDFKTVTPNLDCGW